MTKPVPLRGLFAALLIPLSFSSVPATAAPLKVVVSFSILADLVREVGGGRVNVTAFVGPDTDMHVFQPAPGAARELLGADLVIINGLGFEGWADRLVKASGYKGPLVVAAAGIKPRPAAGGRDGHGHGHGKGHAHGAGDPHAWQDVANVRRYVATIRDALVGADTPGKAEYEAAAAAYLARLDTLDAELRAMVAAVPQEQRRVITSHDAFAYLGAAYGITFLAPQGVGGDSEPTARGVASLIRQIKRHNVKAVFVENISNPRVIEQIARETGARLGGTLYSDALSEPEGPAGNYIAMMRHNMRMLVTAMRGDGS